MKNAQELAMFMHDKYEYYAVKNGWKTQAQCRVAFNDLPDANKNTMICVAEHILELEESAITEHDNEIISEIEKLIEDAEARKLVDINYQEKWTARIKALTEIINLIKGKK